MTNTVSLNLVIGTYIVFITQKISKPFWNTCLSPFKHHYMNKQIWTLCLTGLALWSGHGVCDMKQNIAISKGLLHSWEILPMSHTPWQHGIRIEQCYLLSGMANETFLQKQTVVGSYSTLSLIFALWPLAAVSAGRPPISWDFSTLLCWICNILFVLLVLYIIF